MLGDRTVTHRVLSLPELLRSILFSLPKHRDTYHAALVCRIWSECALDVLWYKVEDVCVLFNVLVPLTKPDSDSPKVFVRCPRPQDWVTFKKYSQRVKKLHIGGTSELPSQSVFDDIGRSRIQQTILPNLWSLIWLSDPLYCVTFLHSGIRDLTIWIDVNLPDQVETFIHNARFFCQNIVTLGIQIGFSDVPDPHSVRPVVAELSDWLAELQNLQELALPMFWTTTHVFQSLSQLNHLVNVKYSYDPRGYGNPLDTMTFNPTLDYGSISGPFPSLTILAQSSPFSTMVSFISSWQSASRLTDLTISSQNLESPNSFRSILKVITDSCPLLTDLGLTCLITPYRYHPQSASGSSEKRITLDILLPLEKLTHLKIVDITHSLPLALTDDDFITLLNKLPSTLRELHLAADPYPLGNDAIHTMEAPLSILPTPDPTQPSSLVRYPLPGLWQSTKSLRKYCPQLKSFSIFGIDDFSVSVDDSSTTNAPMGAVNDTVRLDSDEPTPPPLPFPNLRQFSFGTSLLTSDKMVIAYGLSQYVLPDVKFSLFRTWGGDEGSPYLTYLNLKPLFPIGHELDHAFQELIESASPEIPNANTNTASSNDDFPNVDVDEPVGVDGVIDRDTRMMLKERDKEAEEVGRLLSFMARARVDEREKAEKRRGMV